MAFKRLSGTLVAGALTLNFLSFCGKKENQVAKIFELTKPSETGINFVNTVPENDTLNQSTYHYIFNGNGVAVGDLNNDGLPEVIFTGNEKPAALYLNKGDFKFEDITQKAGLKTQYWMSGITLADVNGDGYQDIYICRSGPDKMPERRRNLLFINNKNLTFTEKAGEWGIDDPGNATCATFFDMDNDGDLDMYLGNHAEKFFQDMDQQFDRKRKMAMDNQQHLYRNDGNKYTDISEEAGVLAKGYCLSASAADFNNDGFTDLYICNDYQLPDYYYLNNGDGTFKECLNQYFKHTSMNSMGADMVDYNQDGWTDIMTVDMLSYEPRRFMLLAGNKPYEHYITLIKKGFGFQDIHNTLQTNNKGKGFSDLAYLNGVARSDWSWSPLFADFDNDGLSDLFITNGYYRDVTNMDFMLFQNRKEQQMKQIVSQKEILEKLPFEKLTNFAYKNNGNYNFSMVSNDWGLEEPTLSTGSTYADLDKNGTLDLIICNQGEAAHVYKNVAKGNNYLRLKLNGANNKFGIGCKVYVETDSSKYLNQMQQSRGYQSCTEPIMHIGAGNAAAIKKLTVIWPGGKFQVLENVKTNQLLEVSEKNASGSWNYSIQDESFFTDETKSSGLDFVHEEGYNPDFKRETLLPHSFNQLGPASATGDVNGDGIADLIISNAFNSRGPVLYLQDENGKLRKSGSQPWAVMKETDVLGTLIFDADADGDNDIYLSAGGAEHMWPNPKYKHRLYFNDGKGNFTEKKDALPDIKCSGSCVAGGDVDGDGDIDLFVASRIKPGFYPEMGEVRSYLLKNDGGIFNDITQFAAPDLMYPGMLCAAVFADYNGDNLTDLILAGEWMPVVFMKNTGSKLVNQTGEAGTAAMTGWFNSILPVDIDNDGDLDFVAGNKGDNSFFRANPEDNLRIYWADLDNNGRANDLWLSYTRAGKEYPYYSLDEMAESYPTFMRKRFTTYTEYAGKSIDQIFDVDNLKKNSLKASEFSNLLLRNNGGVFSIEHLPMFAQAGPIYGLIACDVDGNGFQDIIGIGNNFSTRVQHGKDDAFNGFILFNKEGQLTFNSGESNGFYVPGDGKSLVWLPGKSNGLTLIATQNKDKSLLFKEKKKKLRFIPAPKGSIYAKVQLKSGKTRVESTGFGAGYISVSAPGVWINEQVSGVQFVMANGKTTSASI